MTSPGSSDEGEIIETGVGAGDTKATSLPQIHGTGVDRPDRNRVRYSRSRSPDRETASRYSQNSSTRQRSRSPRGFKRARNDDGGSRSGRMNGGDPRQFRVHYEDARDSRRSRYTYDDDDRPPSRSSTSGLRYDDSDRSRDHDKSRGNRRDRDRDAYPDKRARNRTRSPYRAPRGGRDRGDRDGRDDNRYNRASDRDRDGYGRNGQHDASKAGGRTPKAGQGTYRDHTRNVAGSPQDEPMESTTAQATVIQEEIPEEEPLDEAAEIERRRRRREELLSKNRGPAPMLVQALQGATISSPAHTQQSTPLATDGNNTPRSGKTMPALCILGGANGFTVVSSPSSPARGMQEGMSPAALDIANDQDLINTHGPQNADDDDDGPSAADYDPTADMREDEKRDELRHGHVGPHGEILPPDQKAEIAPKPESKVAETTENNDDDDDFDMFADDFDEDKFAAPKPILQPEDVADDGAIQGAMAQAGGILEGDDKEGYYKIRIGEIMNGRYQVQTTLGKGMFSGVARAVDITNKQTVAIKMMRNNDALRKGGFTEIAILQKLNESDPENRKHIVKFERHFEHKGHLCLAFENLSLNLREVLKKFGNNVGINLGATRSYAHQMFVALAHMRKCSIIHADIKPDNILVGRAHILHHRCSLADIICTGQRSTQHSQDL